MAKRETVAGGADADVGWVGSAVWVRAGRVVSRRFAAAWAEGSEVAVGLGGGVAG